MYEELVVVRPREVDDPGGSMGKEGVDELEEMGSAGRAMTMGCQETGMYDDGLLYLFLESRRVV
jgi:hypothetical protein